MALFRCSGNGGQIVTGTITVPNNVAGTIDFGAIPKRFSVIGMTVSDGNAYETHQFDSDFKPSVVVDSSAGTYTTETNWTPASTYTITQSTRERRFYYMAEL